MHDGDARHSEFVRLHVGQLVYRHCRQSQIDQRVEREVRVLAQTVAVGAGCFPELLVPGDGVTGVRELQTGEHQLSETRQYGGLVRRDPAGHAQHDVLALQRGHRCPRLYQA